MLPLVVNVSIKLIKSWWKHYLNQIPLNELESKVFVTGMQNLKLGALCYFSLLQRKLGRTDAITFLIFLFSSLFYTFLLQMKLLLDRTEVITFLVFLFCLHFFIIAREIREDRHNYFFVFLFYSCLLLQIKEQTQLLFFFFFFILCLYFLLLQMELEAPITSYHLCFAFYLLDFSNFIIVEMKLEWTATIPIFTFYFHFFTHFSALQRKKGTPITPCPILLLFTFLLISQLCKGN